MSAYAVGHIKRGPGGEVALRNYFDEANPQLAPMAWKVIQVNGRTRHASTEEVDGWQDLHVPEPEQ